MSDCTFQRSVSASSLRPAIGTQAGEYRCPCHILIRSDNARPLQKILKDKIVAEHNRYLPKNKLGEALTYALGQWVQLERYLLEVRLEIDNPVEPERIDKWVERS